MKQQIFDYNYINNLSCLLQNMKKIILALWLIFSFFTLSTFAINWDNDNYLDDTFWAQNPTDSDIINALYGDGTGWTDTTAYTEKWDSLYGEFCNPEIMSVIHLTPGESKIPLTLEENKIYILEPGNYITTNYINLNNCASIVWKKDMANIFSSTGLTNWSQGTIYNNGKEWVIIDNINVDGINNWIWGTHTKNTNSIYLYLAINNTIHNIKAHDNSSYWIYLLGNSRHNIIIDTARTYNSQMGIQLSYYWRDSYFNNIESFNNTYYGISLYLTQYANSWKGNYFTNIKCYNNTVAWIGLTDKNYNNYFNNIEVFNNQDGIYFAARDTTFANQYNMMNNVLSYNNSRYWIYFYSNSSYNFFNNINIYNNNSYWLYFYAVNTIKYNRFRNINIYNNTNGLYSPYTSTYNSFYDTLNIYSNKTSNIVWTIWNFIVWSGDTYSSLWRSTGNRISTGTLDRSLFTNPEDSDENYLLDWNETTRTNLIGKKTFSNSWESRTSFGYNIPKQDKPIIRILSWWSWDIYKLKLWS